MCQTDNNLKLLGIFHFVLAGVVAMFALIPAIYLVFGLLMSFSPAIFDSGKGISEAPPVIIGVIFSAVGIVGMLLILTLGILLFAAGRNLTKTRNLMFCTVVAAVACVFMPFGTILGVLTLVELNKQEVRSLFGRAPEKVAAVTAGS